MTITKGAERPWQAPFLAALRAGTPVTRAMREAGVPRSTARHRRKRDARFASAWDAALAAARAGDDRPSPAPPYWRALFIDTLARTSNVAASAAAVNIPTATAYKARRDDPAFARKWRAALLEGYEHLELEVLAQLRGHTGEHRIDIANAIRLLSAHRRTVAEMRAAEGEEQRSEEEIFASINDLIDRMRREDGDLPPEGMDERA